MKIKGCVVFLFLQAFSLLSFAQTENLVIPSALQDVKLNGLLDFYYLYDFNIPQNAGNPASSYGASPNETVAFMPKTYHDQFTLNMATFGAKKEALTPQSWGFNLQLAFGPEADLMATNNSDNSLRALNQASLIYKTPFDLVVELGRFLSFLGYESYFANNNINYTKGYGTIFATPALLTGVHLTKAFSENFKAEAYLVNGWNKAYDNNKSKSFGGVLTYKPMGALELVAKALSGNETTNSGADVRSTFEGNATYFLNPDFKIAGVYIYTQESISGGVPRKVSSIAAYAYYKIKPEFSVGARYEIYTDDSLFTDGLKTAIPSAVVAQTINSYSLTGVYHVSENLKFKGEYKIDVSSASPFADANNVATSSQAMALFAGVLAF